MPRNDNGCARALKMKEFNLRESMKKFMIYANNFEQKLTVSLSLVCTSRITLNNDYFFSINFCSINFVYIFKNERKRAVMSLIIFLKFSLKNLNDVISTKVTHEIFDKYLVRIYNDT